MPLPNVICHIVVGAYQAKLFSKKIFSLNSVLEIDKFVGFMLIVFKTSDLIALLYSVDIDNLTGSISTKESILAL